MSVPYLRVRLRSLSFLERPVARAVDAARTRFRGLSAVARVVKRAVDAGEEHTPPTAQVPPTHTFVQLAQTPMPNWHVAPAHCCVSHP